MLYFVFGCGGVFRIGHQSCVGGSVGGERVGVGGINGATFYVQYAKHCCGPKVVVNIDYSLLVIPTW